jgi:hypothetical protein
MDTRYLMSALIGLLIAMAIFGTVTMVRHLNQPAPRPASQAKKAIGWVSLDKSAPVGVSWPPDKPISPEAYMPHHVIELSLK